MRKDYLVYSGKFDSGNHAAIRIYYAKHKSTIFNMN